MIAISEGTALWSKSRCAAAWLKLACVAIGLSAVCAGLTPAAASPASETPWTASWISASSGESSPGFAGLPIFRREVALDRRIARATLRIAGLGQYEVHVNGSKVTDAVLTPGWTDYRKHILYDTYDATALLHAGRNALGVMLGNGMYNVVETKGRYTKFAASFGAPKLILQLDLTYADGSTDTLISDGQWKTAAGPITYSSIYGGEDYDARLEQPGWDRAGFPDASWNSVAVVDGPGGALIPEATPPVRAFESFTPVSTTHPAPGIAVYDLGQNFAGWPELSVAGQRGAAIKIVAGELLDAHGRVTQRSANAYPDAQNEFNYVLRGGTVEHWEPRFSYYGFRYVEVRTDPAAGVRLLRLRGRFLHAAVRVEGTFSTSDRQLQRIHGLIDRAILSNTMSVLTDCPHREKLAWLEQTHLAAPSLLFNYDLAAVYAKMAMDMEDAQLANGMVPDIAPEYPVFEGSFRDSPEWGAAIVLSPWAAYRFYGDLGSLQAHYAAMTRYAAYLRGKLKGGLLTYGLGDWYDIGPGAPGESKLTTKGVTATATYFELLTALAKIATLTGHAEDASAFTRESEAIKQAFNAAYFHPETGVYDTGSQTAQAMPLAVGLVPEAARGAVLRHLIEDIRAHQNHVTAGDIGFHYVVRALTDGGRSDVLYDMLKRTDAPSYGNQLAHGATALTEAWDANPESSQNHFMLGHAEEWFYRGLAGLDVDMSRPADARIRIAPAFVGHVRRVRARYDSVLGRIESRWTRIGRTVTLDVLIPKAATATVVLPANPAGTQVGQGHHRFRFRLARMARP